MDNDDFFPAEGSVDFDDLMRKHTLALEQAERERFQGRKRFKEIIGIQEGDLDVLIQEIKRYPVPDRIVVYGRGYEHFALLFYFEEVE